MDFKSLRVSTDTRSIRPGDVFFALKGERFDGHDFIAQALSKGAGTIVYSRPECRVDSDASVKWIPVDDTLRAYGDWAAQARLQRGIPVVAVTGSSGKTTVKEMLAHVLSGSLAVHKTHGTENNLVGVPKTIFECPSGSRAMVLELGTSFPGEIARLSAIAQPDQAIVTRVGPSHLQGLGSIEGVLREKLSIAEGLRKDGVLWLNADDPVLAAVRPTGVRVMRAGQEGSGADLTARAVREEAEVIRFEAEGCAFRLPCLGRHNVSNALLVLGAAKAFGLTAAQVAGRLESFRPVSGRLAVRRIESYTFLDDTYNANPLSFEAALAALAAYPSRGRKLAVAGDMLELGEQSEQFHRQLGRQAAQARLDGWITAGERCRAAADEAVRAGMDASAVCACADSAQAAEALRAVIRPGDVVLVKGSRGMKMEKVFECFSPSYTR